MATKIVIDAGHNGLSDPGAVYNGRRESDDTLRLAMAVGEILSRSGYDVDYTRTGNINQSVIQKAQLANDTDADLFISIHRNMSEVPGSYHGVQSLVYDLSGPKLTMAEAINKNLEGVGFRNINVEARPNLAVLRRTKMPAILVEVGFIDSAEDNKLFDTRLDEIAQAIADGIQKALEEEEAMKPEYYQIQTGAYRNQELATQQLTQLKSQGFPAFLVYEDGLYKVRVGAFLNLDHAVAMEKKLREYGYSTVMVKKAAVL